MASITLRETQPTDWASIRTIFIEGIDGNKATFTRVCPAYDTWNESHLDVGRFVICSDALVCGWVALSPTSSVPAYSGVAEVSLYIANAHHRKGFGELLLKHLILCSEQNGIWTLYAGIMADNEPSLRLHEKCGFRTIGYRERIARDKSGQWRSTIVMERRSPSPAFD